MRDNFYKFNITDADVEKLMKNFDIINNKEEIASRLIRFIENFILPSCDESENHYWSLIIDKLLFDYIPHQNQTKNRLKDLGFSLSFSDKSKYEIYRLGDDLEFKGKYPRLTSTKCSSQKLKSLFVDAKEQIFEIENLKEL